MKRIAVKSSSVISVGYDETRKILEVEFHGGAVYQYSNVPRADYDRLLDGRSIGRYINECIKARYAVKKLRDSD